ncbi:DUF3696 domain-containing protein [Lapillicoccus jejuensis]|uniref:Putative ATPase n=1 Tax=Lapillicoccus jejuensis TaxID=402171 RepID=A0A542DZC9_9MICO|nr:DUF3696 domain-containing protein [Lapillicoccus jejuensis]TQJ08445.1 putative ATPase [Lapillicoccus jejuensis]
MIKSLELVAFKKFAHFQMPMRSLTVLTGLNGSGKSTITQSLLLAHQASLSKAPTVPLTAEPGLDLGEEEDVLHEAATSDHVEINISDGFDHRWTFQVGAGRELPHLYVLNRPAVPPAPFGSSALTYLSAERLGPRTSHQTVAVEDARTAVGEDGRFVAHALAVNAQMQVSAARRHESAGNVITLPAQTEAWLSSVVGPTQIETALVPRTRVVTMHVRPRGSGRWLLPTNTGFGISYTLPVIVAGLLAPKNGLLIVDAPEAHLHASAQASIGAFLATIAGSGVQVVVETHSEHVLNGIRRAVAINKVLPSAEVGLVFFGAEGASFPTMDDQGRLDHWPPLFFDQLDTDLGELTRARRG